MAGKENGISIATDPTLTSVWVSEETLDAWRMVLPGEELCRPALAPVSGSVERFGFDPKTISFPLGGSET